MQGVCLCHTLQKKRDDEEWDDDITMSGIVGGIIGAGGNHNPKAFRP